MWLDIPNPFTSIEVHENPSESWSFFGVSIVMELPQ
jgi:hypothetical protein